METSKSVLNLKMTFIKLGVTVLNKEQKELLHIKPNKPREGRANLSQRSSMAEARLLHKSSELMVNSSRKASLSE